MLADAPSPSYGFPPEKRLRRSIDFSQVYANGRSWSHPLLAMRVRANNLPQSRVGFAVGKRVGNSVIRNRVRRRLRDIIRQLEIAPGLDMVIIGRQSAAGATYPELREALMQVLRRARALPAPDDP